MRTWYQKSLGDGVAAYGPIQEILEAFEASQETRGTDSTAVLAVFSRYDLRENLVTVYFSPDAETMAKAFGASPCERPARKGLELLASCEARCWEILFPGPNSTL